MKKLKKICSVIVAYVLVLSMVISPFDAMAASTPQFAVEDCTVVQGDEFTVDSSSTYSVLELYEFHDGELSETTTQNIYEFIAPESAYYKIEYWDKSYNDLKLKWVVQNSDGTILRTHEGTPESAFFQFMNEGETYYFGVSQLDNNTETISYRCIVRMVEQELTVGEETLDPGGFFSFTPEESGTYRFYDATELLTRFEVYDLDYNLLAGGGADALSLDAERVVCELEGGQTYFLDVHDWGESGEDCYVGVKKLHGEPTLIEIDWTEEDYTLEQGSYVRLKTIIFPEDCIAGDVEWTTSNESVVYLIGGASIGKAITIATVNNGTAVITATLANGLSDSITITVVGGSEPDIEPDEEVTLTSVEIENMPSKTVYEIGETLDTNGLKLRFTYSNGSSGITDFGYTTSGFDSATAGSKTVTVEYGGLTTSFTVTVNEEQVLEDSAQLIMSGLETMAGKEITVALTVENNPGIAGLAVSLKYDESVLTLKDTENGGLFSGFTAAKNFAWDESEDVVEDGVLATYTFVVAEDAPAGDYDIEVIIRSCTNDNLDDVELVTVNGKISVIDFIYGDSNGDQKIDMKDVVLLRKYITNFDYDTNTSSENVEFGADANGDDKIDMKDVVILRKYITNYDYDTDSSTVVLGPQ